MQFTRYLGKAVCQYQLYTPTNGPDQWMPQLPQLPSIDELASVFKIDISNIDEINQANAQFRQQNLIDDISCSPLDTCNGKTALDIQLGIHNIDPHEIATNRELLNTVQNLSSVSNDLTTIEIDAIATQMLNMQLQSDDADYVRDDGYHRKLKTIKTQITNMLIEKKQSKVSGLLMWLNDSSETSKSAKLNIYFDRPSIARDITDIDSYDRSADQKADYDALVEKADQIARVCANSIDNVETHFTWTLVKAARTIQEATGDFKFMNITDYEVWLNINFLHFPIFLIRLT